MKFGFAKAAFAASALTLGMLAPAGLANEATPTDTGLLVGKTEAQNKLIGWASYTCSHCARFANEGEPALALAYLPTGKINYEIRPFIRHVVDLTATLAVNCGDSSKRLSNHQLMMREQPVWLAKAMKITEAQGQRWTTGSFSSRMRAIAGDLDFYELMERNGYRQADLDVCLADEAAANRIAEQSRADIEAFGLRGTPSFALNGELLDATHGWAALEPHLDAALAAAN